MAQNDVDDEFSLRQMDMTTLQQVLPQIDITQFLGNIEPFLGENGSIRECLPRDLPCDHTTPYRFVLLLKCATF
jgi:hypothetical protein